MPYFVYDIVIVLALLLFVWLGYKRGLVLTLCSLLAVFVALIGASFLSDALAEPVAKAIEPAVTRSIHDTVTSYRQRAPEVGATSEDEEAWLQQLPLNEVLEPLMESKFFQGFAESFQQAVDDKATEIITHAARELAHYVAVQIARTIIFVAAFAAVLIAWHLLSRALDLVARLPVLSTVNAWGGGAVGLVRGALIVFIAVWLLRDSYIPREAVEGSVLLRFFAGANPLSFFL